MDAARQCVLFAGRTTLDVLYRLDGMPEEDTKAYATALHAGPGGPATNAAITHALLGGDAVLLSPLGSGPWAAMARETLATHRVHHIDLANGASYETPLVTVLVNTARATRTAINPPLTQSVFAAPDAWNAAWGAQPHVALTDGFHLHETLPLLRACRDAGAALVLDGGSWKPGTEELAPLLTAAICSERFALHGAERDAQSTLTWFAAQGVPFVAVTRGPQAILVLERGRRYEIAIAPANAIDTLGAGDVLHGSFCTYLARTGNCELALREAARIATQSCTDMGIDAWQRAR